MTDPLVKLFGSDARIKLLRLFLFNPKSTFTVVEAAQRARITEKEARREIALFTSLSLTAKMRRPAKAGRRYAVNTDFTYLAALQNLLLNAPTRGIDLYSRIRPAGSIKLLVLSGIFVGEWEARLDVLIVGDRVQERKLQLLLKKFESEIGKELRYALLPTDDFLYRLNMNDHLVRDVMDYPHTIVFDRLNIGLK